MVRSRSASTVFIVIVVFLDTLGVGLIIPVAPRLVGSFLGGELASASRYVGLLFSLYSAMQLVFAPILGGLSDRFGRRPVILSSLFGAGLSYLLSAFSPALSWLFVGRVIAGITGASFSAATAYIADVTPAEGRGKAFGLIGASLGLGFIVGPGLGGVLGGIDLRLPYFVAAALNLLNLLYGVFVLPESLRREDRRPFSFRRANPFGSLLNLGRHPLLLGLTGTMICGYLAQMILQSVWALHGQARFGWSTAEVGGSLVAVGLATALVQGGLIRVVLPRLGERRALLFGLVMSVAGYLAFGLADRGWMIYAIILPFALGGVAGPSIQALISRVVGPSEQGELQGSLTTLSSLAAIVGPQIGTRLLARFGPEDARPHVPGAAFFAAACLNLVGLGLAVRLFARAPVAEPAAKPEAG